MAVSSFPVLETCETGDTNCRIRNLNRATDFIQNLLNEYDNRLWAKLNTGFTNLQTSILQQTYNYITAVEETLSAAQGVITSNTQSLITKVNAIPTRIDSLETSLKSAVNASQLEVDSRISSLESTLINKIDNIPSQIEDYFSSVLSNISSNNDAIISAIKISLNDSVEEIQSSINDININIQRVQQDINTNIRTVSVDILNTVTANDNRIIENTKRQIEDTKNLIKDSNEALQSTIINQSEQNALKWVEIVNDIKQFVVDQFTTTTEGLTAEYAKQYIAQQLAYQQLKPKKDIG